ncbi:MAG: hypothetical protein IPL73_03320 [Candidatus Obscuribacter sp.]|nr:hypothetical protein [Candidatus Obscuribacter sp.]
MSSSCLISSEISSWIMSALKLFASLSLLLISSINFAAPCFCAGRETDIPDFQFQPIKPTAAITIAEAVDIAVRNYPTIAQKHFKLRASMANVSLAKNSVSAQPQYRHPGIRHHRQPCRQHNHEQRLWL